MSMCGSLQHIFENPSLPENPTLLESLSWNQVKSIQYSFTEIFGELHFKENHTTLTHNNNEHGSNTTPTTHKNTLSSESLHLCTEGLGFESSDEVEDSKINNGENSSECWESEERERNGENKKERLGLEDWCDGDEWRTRSSIRVNNNGVEYPPSISCIGKSGKPWVSFMSFRDNGRFVLREVRTPVQEFLHAHREDGRLKLHFVQPEDEEKEEGDDDGDCCNHGEEEDYDEVESVDEGEEHMGKENDESGTDIK